MSQAKNIEEVLDLLEALGKVVADCLQDGKINILDLPKIARLWDPVKVALQDIQLIIVEAKDLDGEAVQRLIVKSVAAVKAWMAVFEKSALTKAA